LGYKINHKNMNEGAPNQPYQETTQEKIGNTPNRAENIREAEKDLVARFDNFAAEVLDRMGRNPFVREFSERGF
jgi:hypothetical protein